MEKFGITESGEISFHLEAFDSLYDGNIIITKRLTNGLIGKLIENKERIILHLTVTGWGGSEIEPFVPKVEVAARKFRQLIEGGFPVEQCVLRIDPIIPTAEGIERMRLVILHFFDFYESGIKRVRFSVMDMYDHVRKRFTEKNIAVPYETFHAPLEERMMVYNMLCEFGKTYGFDVEACGEPGIESISCLSQRDVDILGLTDRVILVGDKGQRSNCHCPANKTELLPKGDDKAKKCKNSCLYCFWHD